MAHSRCCSRKQHGKHFKTGLLAETFKVGVVIDKLIIHLLGPLERIITSGCFSILVGGFTLLGSIKSELIYIQVIRCVIEVVEVHNCFLDVLNRMVVDLLLVAS